MVLPLTGTVAVENGLDTFTWTGAPLTALNCVLGASIVVNGLGYFVKELTDTTHGTFTRVYAEATSGSQPAEIEQLSPEQVATATLNKRAAEVFAQISVVEANGRGFLVRFSDNTADADPGPGYMAINHTSIASATVGYFDVLDGNGAAADVEIDTWDDSSSLTKGLLSLRSVSDPSARHLFKIAGSIVDGGSYRKVSWIYVGGSGSFAADEEMMAFFAPTGDRGDGFIVDADAADPSGLTAYEAEAAGYLVFVTDLSTLFASAYDGRSGVVRLIAGPDWELAALYTGPEINPRFDIVLDDGGKPGSGEVLLVLKLTVAVNLAANLAGSQVVVRDNPEAEAAYSYTKNGAEVATLTIATDGGTTFVSASTDFAIGDVFSVIAPNPRDATLSGVSQTIAFTR